MKAQNLKFSKDNNKTVKVKSSSNRALLETGSFEIIIKTLFKTLAHIGNVAGLLVRF